MRGPPPHAAPLWGGLRVGWLRAHVRDLEEGEPRYSSSPIGRGLSACTVGATTEAVNAELVRDEIVKAMGYWLELGISGFRVDAVPFVIETTGVDAQELARFHDPHSYLRELREFVGRRTGDGILLGECNLPHKDQKTFFGGSDGDELTIGNVTLRFHVR